jgi:hypothetical protein
MTISSRSLLVDAIEAHGGLARWNQLKSADIHCLVNGVVWTVKAVPGILTNFHYQIDLHEQRGTFPNFMSLDQRATFEARRVAIETTDGTVVEELLQPGASLEGQTLQSTWSRLQLIYFVGYAIWSYATAPFSFAMPGFATEELDPPWQEGDETWRRLKVTFPDYLARHAKEQTYYFGEDGLLRRHDYVAEPVTKDAVATHYITDNKDFLGITLGTRQRIYVLNPDGGHTPEPLLVSLDIEELVFT